MAGPQLEDGFTRFANELLEALYRVRLTKRQYKIVLYVARWTYGYYGEKMAVITPTKAAKATDMDVANASRTINGLVKAGVLLKRQGPRGLLYGISKHYTGWKLLPKQQGKVGLPKQQQILAKTATNPCQSDNVHPIEKEKRNKKGAPTVPPQDMDVTIWDIGVHLGIPRALLGKAVKDHGKARVAEVVGAMAVTNPADPQSYFASVLAKPAQEDGYEQA